jgi:hypothetical protein
MENENMKTTKVGSGNSRPRKNSRKIHQGNRSRYIGQYLELAQCDTIRAIYISRIWNTKEAKLNIHNIKI